MRPEARALIALARAKAATHNQKKNTALLALLTAWFESNAALAATELPPDILAALTQVGLDQQAAGAIGRELLAKPMSGRNRHGSPSGYAGMPATRFVASQEPHLRAMYLLAALTRLTDARQEDHYPQAFTVEQNYLNAHVAAGRNRRRAAKKVDALAGDDGHLLVWRAVMDDRVDPTCAALNGRMFRASNPPDGLLPGAVHPRCRCVAEPWGGMYIPIS